MKQVLQVLLDEETLEKLRELAERDDTSLSAVGRRLIRQGLAAQNLDQR